MADKIALLKLDPCYKGYAWASMRHSTLEEAYQACERPDWLIWYYDRTGQLYRGLDTLQFLIGLCLAVSDKGARLYPATSPLLGLTNATMYLLWKEHRGKLFEAVRLCHECGPGGGRREAVISLLDFPDSPGNQVASAFHIWRYGGGEALLMAGRLIASWNPQGRTTDPRLAEVTISCCTRFYRMTTGATPWNAEGLAETVGKFREFWPHALSTDEMLKAAKLDLSYRRKMRCAAEKEAAQ